MLKPIIEPLTEHATQQQLSRVLALAMNDNSQWSLLSAVLADSSALAADLAALVKDSPYSGSDWLSVVCDDHLSSVKLREIKGLAKAWIQQSTREGERVAATLLYHGAVAAAWGRCGENISERSPAVRGPLYEDLADILFAHPLGKVFQAAADKIAEEQSCGKQDDVT